ncbi:NAD-dependent epimerase/dehydratase family protein [uncultured Winogradskyella sp.]|uniref:NAD-dependent epimerase/dehydratase family protein n=1 Tax=uncultured Winogradskyella sp. TaxID=395353 RepID=UPI002605C233|nr:NAD-dependent epimerase/dehydratase family protein [uncultured Winogradskyella sp.]
MDNIRVGITCVGSGIGQSIIDSCRLSDLPLVTFGLDNSAFAYGLYECDHIIEIPNATSANYVENIISICLQHNIQILIPGLDDELQLFSKNIEKFNQSGIKIIISGEKVLNLVRDKAMMTKDLSSVADIFVQSFYTKEDFLEALNSNKANYPVIAKPSGGSASTDVHIIFDASDFHLISKNHIIQEIAKPHKDDVNIKLFEEQISKRINPQISEISIQLVANRVGDIIGKMASFNRLKNGVPIEIIPYENADVWNEIDKIIPAIKSLGLRGPLNIQGRMTDKGLKIFEMNARFTGITGLRALMGFNEVEACIKSWFDIGFSESSLQINNSVFGTRQVLNKSIHKDRNPKVESLFSKINPSQSSETKKILFTGATGFLGRNLIDELLKQNISFAITALVRDKPAAQLILPQSIKIYDIDDLEKGNFSLGSVDVLLHLGFARPHKKYEEIAESLAFTAKIFRRAVENQLSNIINISSQSVYGQGILPLWNESTMVAPNSPYSSAKYSTELILNELSHQNKHLNTTSLRLAGTTGGAKGLINVDLMSKFVKMVKEGQDLSIVGGAQVFERIDVRDAVSGIISLLNSPSNNWKPIYNLGSGHQFTLLDMAEEIIKIGKIYNSDNSSKINIETKDVDLKFGMDITSFCNDMGWKPKYSFQDTIHSLFKFDY